MDERSPKLEPEMSHKHTKHQSDVSRKMTKSGRRKKDLSVVEVIPPPLKTSGIKDDTESDDGDEQMVVLKRGGPRSIVSSTGGSIFFL